MGPGDGGGPGPYPIGNDISFRRNFACSAPTLVGVKRLLVVLVLFATACSSEPMVSTEPAATETPAPSRTQTEAPTSTTPKYTFPGPDARVPSRPVPMTRAIREATRDLPRAIDQWLANGGVRLSPAGHRIALGGLWQQRLYRQLIVHPRLRAKVSRRVPNWLAARIARHVKAGAGLRSLATPTDGPIKLKATPPTPHRALKRFYRKAQRRFGIPWYMLASVNFVESKFGRLLGPSSAGAMGPMQFMPATWDAYGNGGDIMDPHDSIMGAARYLRASGAPADMRGALWAYNHSFEYVDAIQIYAREIKRDPRMLYAYYFWQVFFRTTKGDVQLTGPGKDR